MPPAPSPLAGLARYAAFVFLATALLALAILTFDILLGDDGDDFWHELAEIVWLPAVFGATAVSPKSSCDRCVLSRAVARLFTRRKDLDDTDPADPNPYHPAHDT